MYDCLVVGCGMAGTVIARELAERADKKVLVLEMSDHIGGNAYNLLSESGILVHQFGPHIFHTDNKRVFDYLSRFTQWAKLLPRGSGRHTRKANTHSFQS